MKLIEQKDNLLYLNTLLSEAGFGKTNYDSILQEKGLIAQAIEFNKGIFKFQFKVWNFSDVKALNDPTTKEIKVFYTGEFDASNNSKSLYEFIENQEEKEKAFMASFAVICAITQAAKENLNTPQIGAGGILVDLDLEHLENTKLLFLPENLFKYAVNGLSEKEFSQLQGYWINPTLIELPSVCYNRAVIAYKIITDSYPFSEINQIARNADILDKKFLPVDLKINGLDSNLAKEINKGLKLNANVVNTPGKKKRGKASEDLCPTVDFPLEVLFNQRDLILNPPSLDQEFLQKAETYMKTKESKVKSKRFFRKNYGKLIGIAIGIIAVVISSFEYYKTRGEEITSKGLNSKELVEVYFQGINKLDTIQLDNISKGKTVKRYNDTVSQIFVLSKQRQSVAGDNGYLSPQNWLFSAVDSQKDKRCGIYGVSNVYIDNELSNLNTNYYLKNENPNAVVQENGQQLTDGMETIHKVEYFNFYTDGEDHDFAIEKIKASFTLTYKKDRWIITEYISEDELIDFNCKLFKAEYFDLVKENNYDVRKTVEELRNKYPWLPQAQVMEQEFQRLLKLAEEQSKSIFPVN